MKIALFALLFVASLAAAAQMGQSPSDRAFERHERQSERIMNQPLPVQPPKLDLRKIKIEADELATLAQTLPAQIDQAGHGALPNGLSENLRKIEKLSKQLRRDLSL